MTSPRSGGKWRLPLPLLLDYPDGAFTPRAMLAGLQDPASESPVTRHCLDCHRLVCAALTLLVLCFFLGPPSWFSGHCCFTSAGGGSISGRCPCGPVLPAQLLCGGTATQRSVPSMSRR